MSIPVPVSPCPNSVCLGSFRSILNRFSLHEAVDSLDGNEAHPTADPSPDAFDRVLGHLELASQPDLRRDV